MISAIGSSKTLAAAVTVLAAALIQFGEPPAVQYTNRPYNGLFTFVRVRYSPSRWGPGNYMWGLDLKWNHDYPRGEAHFLKILNETTTVAANPTGNIIALDDPELFKYPVAYICEVGYWTLTDKEATSLRSYLSKGGFLIVDDFDGDDLYNFTEQIERVLPGARLIELGVGHAVFDAFFKIEALPGRDPVSFRRRRQSNYYGVFEDNDPSKRMMVMANHNTDLSEYWEWSDTGYAPIELSNDAYKLGVNYVVYAMTH